MKDYSVNLKQLDPTLFKNGIANRNQGVSEAERKFIEWLRVNAQEGVTYVSPEGHLVDGTSIIRSRKFMKSATNSNHTIKPSVLNSLSKDTVELKKKVVNLDLSKVEKKITAPIQVSEAERKFLDWVRVNAKEGVTYVSPEGHLFDGTSLVRSKKMLEQFVKKIDATEVVNIIKKFKI